MAKQTQTVLGPDPNPKIASRYDYTSWAQPAVNFDPNDPASESKTNQQDAEGTDLNLMFKKYEKTGLIPDLVTGTLRKPFYGDFTGIGDFHQLASTLARTQACFDAYPADLRARFNNDPAALIAFLADPKNDDEAIRLGIKPKPVPPAPTPAPTPAPQAPAAPAPGQPANPAA